MSTSLEPPSRPQRRSEPRVELTGKGGLLRGCFPVTLLDISEGGVRLESCVAVRPGGSYELTADLDDDRLSARVLIRRSMVCGTKTDLGGSRVMVYRAGASFMDLEPAQRAKLRSALMRLQNGGARVTAGLEERTAGAAAGEPPSGSRRRRWARHRLAYH